MVLARLASVTVQSPGCHGVPSCDSLCGEVLVGARLGGARAPGMEGCGLRALFQRAMQLSPHTGAASWMHFRCEIRLYSSGLAWEEPVLDRWGSRAGAGHSLGGYLARDTRVHCGDGWRPGPASLSGAPASGRVSLGTRGHGDLLAIPALPHFSPWKEVGWPPLGAVGDCVTGEERAQTLAPALHGALNTPMLRWEAPGCFSGLPRCWDDAASGP